MINYFELFNLPMCFLIDKGTLKKALFEIQKKVHPDRLIHANIEDQTSFIDISTIANEGYKILENLDRRIAYILQFKGYIQANEKHSLKPDFLMNMMDLNEEFEFCKTDAEKIAIKEKIDLIAKELYQNIEPLLIKEINDLTDLEFLNIKEYYYQNKYIKRLEH